jgi:hypothetical protein
MWIPSAWRCEQARQANGQCPACEKARKWNTAIAGQSSPEHLAGVQAFAMEMSKPDVQILHALHDSTVMFGESNSLLDA